MAPLYFTSEENGKIFCTRFFFPSTVKYFCSASIVALSHGRAATQSANSAAALCLSSAIVFAASSAPVCASGASSTASFNAAESSSGSTNCATSISGTVIVPVLSTQSTLTLAKVSMHFMSCTNTFCLPSRITDTTIATLANR